MCIYVHVYVCLCIHVYSATYQERNNKREHVLCAGQFWDLDSRLQHAWRGQGCCLRQRGALLRDTFMCATGPSHVCHMIYSCFMSRHTVSIASVVNMVRAWRDLFMCLACLIHVCDMTHSYMLRPTVSNGSAANTVCVWRDSYMYGVWPSHVCDTTHSCVTLRPAVSNESALNMMRVWRDSFICATWLIHVCAVTRSYALRPTVPNDMTHSCVGHD